MTMDSELETMVAREENCDGERKKSFEKFVALKYKAQKTRLVQGWYRVKSELETHHKQKDTNKY